jgi:hypothetical protein
MDIESESETETAAIGERLAAIEREHGVEFLFNYAQAVISAKGRQPDIRRALLHPRAAFAQAIKKRKTPPEEPIVIMELAPEVPPLEAQRANYIRWYSNRPKYCQPSPAELDRMMAACEEGDEIPPGLRALFHGSQTRRAVRFSQ